MTVVTFYDYAPVPRYDSVPWTSILVDESESENGPWTLIDTIPIVPVDPDPSEPAAHTFTTDQATLAAGWYRISFQDDASNVYRTPQMFHGEPIEWIPTLADVGSLVLARTRDQNGNILGTFNDTTHPTADEVRELIDKAVQNVRPRIGTDIPQDLIAEAQNIVAIRTAMYIELTVFANEVAQNRSAYPELKALYDEKLPILANAIAAEEAGLDPSDALGGNYPQYAFPEPTFNYTRPF